MRMRASTGVLMAVICTMTTVSFANEVDACTQQLEGQNCSYSIAGSFVRHGVCQKIGPRNHSLLACLRTSSDPSDPACSRGLFHTASRACCASHCSFCKRAQLQGENVSERLDPACSVDHILRLSPSCSERGAPCVVQSIFGQKDIEKNASARNKRVQQLEGTPVASKQSHDASVVSNLILPLMAGFILSGCSLTVLCYIAHIWTKQRPQTPAAKPSPTSPTTKSCVGPGPGSRGSKGSKSTAEPGSRKERKGRTSEKETLDEELKDIKVTKATKATKATVTETDDVLGELPDAWNLE